MISSPWTRQRLLIPRWRSLFFTLSADELSAPHLANTSRHIPSGSSNLCEKLVLWRRNPGVVTAGELVEAALVEAKESEAIGPAKFLLSTSSSATVPLRRIATVALVKAGRQEYISPTQPYDLGTEKRNWRRRTRIHPENPLAWVELSLHEVLMGRKKAAERSMTVALQLAPTNRHVLRSASRLFLHLDDSDRAYDIIAQSDATVDDPWLIAAELSFAELVMRKPMYFKQGRRILTNAGLMPRQITELAGAIGTLELMGGRRKKARDYFRQSAIDPTGNALAQAEWVSPSFGYEFVTTDSLASKTEAEEANVIRLFSQEKLREVPDVCQRWSNAEGYSIRPYEIASSATTVTGDHAQTVDFAQRGLKIQPDSGILLNNYAFALTHLGEFNKAESALQRIGRNDDIVWLISRANRGLLAMRHGKPEVGLTLYMEAVNGFLRKPNARAADVARIYLAREAALATISEAESLVKSARMAIDRLKTTMYDHVMEEAEQALATHRC